MCQQYVAWPDYMDLSWDVALGTDNLGTYTVAYPISSGYTNTFELTVM